MRHSFRLPEYVESVTVNDNGTATVTYSGNNQITLPFTWNDDVDAFQNNLIALMGRNL